MMPGRWFSQHRPGSLRIKQAADGRLVRRGQCQGVIDLDATDHTLGGRAGGAVILHGRKGQLPLFPRGFEVLGDMDARNPNSRLVDHFRHDALLSGLAGRGGPGA